MKGSIIWEQRTTSHQNIKMTILGDLYSGIGFIKKEDGFETFMLYKNQCHKSIP